MCVSLKNTALEGGLGALRAEQWSRRAGVDARDGIIPFPIGMNLSKCYPPSDRLNKRGRERERERVGERKSEKQKVWPVTVCAVPLLPANAGNEEIGSHQNMRAISSRAHLCEGRRRAGVGFSRLTFRQMKQSDEVYERERVLMMSKRSND